MSENLQYHHGINQRLFNNFYVVVSHKRPRWTIKGRIRYLISVPRLWIRSAEVRGWGGGGGGGGVTSLGVWEHNNNNNKYSFHKKLGLRLATNYS